MAESTDALDPAGFGSTELDPGGFGQPSLDPAGFGIRDVAKSHLSSLIAGEYSYLGVPREEPAQTSAPESFLTRSLLPEGAREAIARGLEPPPEQKGVFADVGRSLSHGLEGLIDFASSPGGLALSVLTGGAGALEGAGARAAAEGGVPLAEATYAGLKALAGRIIAGGFGAQVLQQSPELYRGMRDGAEYFGRTGDPSRLTAAITNAVQAGAFGYILGREAAVGPRPLPAQTTGPGSPAPEPPVEPAVAEAPTQAPPTGPSGVELPAPPTSTETLVGEVPLVREPEPVPAAAEPERAGPPTVPGSALPRTPQQTAAVDLSDWKAAYKLKDGTIVEGGAGGHAGALEKLESMGLPVDRADEWMAPDGDGFVNQKTGEYMERDALAERLRPQDFKDPDPTVPGGDVVPTDFSRVIKPDDPLFYGEEVLAPDGQIYEVGLVDQDGTATVTRRSEDLDGNTTVQVRKIPKTQLLRDAIADWGASFGTEEGQRGALTIQRKTWGQKMLAKIVALDRNPFMSAHGQHMLEQLDPVSRVSMHAASGFRGAAEYYYGALWADPIDNALGSGVAQRTAATLQEGGRAGAKERWTDYVKEVSSASPDGVVKYYGDEYQPWVRDALDLTEKRDVANKKFDETVKAYSAGDGAKLQKLLQPIFQKAIDSIPDMSPEAQAYGKTPEFWKAIDLGKGYLDHQNENLLAQNGKPTEYPGPFGVYWGLSYLHDENLPALPLYDQAATLRQRKSGALKGRTGLGGDLDPSVRAHINAARFGELAARTNEHIDTLVKVGALKELRPGERPPTTMELIPGVPEQVRVLDAYRGAMRIVDPDGLSSASIPGKRYYTTDTVWRENAPLFDRSRPVDQVEGLQRVWNTMLELFLRGPVEPAFHSQAMFRNLAFATRETFPQAILRTIRTDLTESRSQDQMMWLADHGKLPDRFGTVSASRELAERYGADYKNPAKLNFSPVIYGRNGIDIRARVASLNWFDDHFPTATDAQKASYIDALGNYVHATRTVLARQITNPAVSPFFTAGSTKIRNTLQMFNLGDSTIPTTGMDTFKWRLRQQLTTGVLGGLSAWTLAHKLFRGQFPWEDKDSYMMEIELSPSLQQSAFFKPFAYRAHGGKTYVGLGGLFPMADEALRLSGVKSAYSTAMRGGSVGQTAERMEAEAVSTVANTLIGPALQLAFTQITGQHPYVTSFHDPTSGRFSPQFIQDDAFRRYGRGPGLSVGAHVMALAEDMFPLALGSAEALRSEPGDEKDREQAAILRKLSSMVLTQTIRQENPSAQRQALRKERTVEQRRKK